MTDRFLLSGLLPAAADLNPAAVAVVCEDQQLTWAELDRRVGLLAGALAAVGVGRGDRVGVYLHKSIESLVAVHGILRAGAVYVPIDPMAPVDTIVDIVTDCGIGTLVTHELRRSGVERLLAAIDPLADSTIHAVLGLETAIGQNGAGASVFLSWSDIDRGDVVSPARSLGDDLAYVMYTSGSTGSPKGIMHTNRSGLNYAKMSSKLFGLGPHDRMANFSPLHFDMSTFEVMAGVAAAATVVIIPEPYLRMPASLAAYLAEQACTTLYTVPSLFQQLLARGGMADHDWSAVRLVLPAGEMFPAEPLAELVATFPRARFCNVYGPAEVNQCTYHHFTEAPTDGRPLPIGVACQDVELDVVDDDDRPVPDGQQGHLLIRTSTMMSGYWNRPDLTAAGFLDREGPGGHRRRWYRSGDLVVRDPDGTVVYFGRSDNQIKIRGNRVELETIEAAVVALPGVEQAVVGLRTDPGGDSLLIALCQLSIVHAETSAGPGQRTPIGIETGPWRRELVNKLPAYAIPARFEPVEAFPRTPSGKIDRRTARQNIASSGADGG